MLLCLTQVKSGASKRREAGCSPRAGAEPTGLGEGSLKSWKLTFTFRPSSSSRYSVMVLMFPLISSFGEGRGPEGRGTMGQGPGQGEVAGKQLPPGSHLPSAARPQRSGCPPAPQAGGCPSAARW